MGLFSKKPRIDPEEFAALRTEFDDLRGRLAASEQARTELEAQLQQLNVTSAGLAARSHLIDDVTVRLSEVDVLKRQIAQIDVVNAKITSLETLSGKVAELSDRVASSSHDASRAKDEAAALQQRVTNVTTELANQLVELGTEIDGLAASKAAPTEVISADQPVSAEVLDQLQTAQVRLANEQARYEIAFRQDLAMLAEQVKRARPER